MFNLAPVPVPDLSNKSILVTGAGQGIGAHLVEILVKNGAHVFAGILREPVGESRELLKGAQMLPLDVRRQDNVEAAITRIEVDAGRLDVLVNNAGIISPIAHLAELESATLAEAFEVNVAGVHRLSRAALSLLRKSRGTIVNAGTGAATTPMEGWTAYCCSKAGAHMLTRMFALELADDGIKSFFIGIPPTDTEMQAKIRKAGLNPISKIPQSELVDPKVPASVMAWLCSNEARAVDEVLLDVRDDFFKDMMDIER